jgi:hypothetical protein
VAQIARIKAQGLKKKGRGTPNLENRFHVAVEEEAKKNDDIAFCIEARLYSSVVE